MVSAPSVIAVLIAGCALALATGPVAGADLENSSGTPLGYHLVHSYSVAQEGAHWDYLTLDGPAHRLYISRSTHVAVMDTASGQIVGDIPGGHRVHGVALAPEFDRGFVSDGTAPGSVIVFDLKTLKVAAVIAVPANGADCIVYDPVSKRVFTFNGESGSATAIDAATGKVVGSIELGGDPEFAVADGKGHLYDNLEDKSEQLEIDARSLKITRRWPLAPCKSPSGLAIDTGHRRLFAGCHNRTMAVVDADGGKVITTLPIGDGVDANAFDPGMHLVFSSNGQSATLTVVHEDSPDRFTEVGNLKTAPAARTMAVDPLTHHVFVVTADMGPRPAAATAQNPRRSPQPIPGTFKVLEYAQ
jgi:DNA-binding beta-propeller fold protein YncE